MQWLLNYAFAMVGRPYHYGGDDPLQGFDCSGFVQELLLAAGEIPFGTAKMNAQMIYKFYEHRDGWGPGALAFFGSDSSHIGHIGFCVDEILMLEAGGGDSHTLLESDAIRQNAFIKLRPIRYRRDFFCVLRPSYAKLGKV